MFILQPSLLITANVPSAKKLIVHGPDLTSIPSQFLIHEDTQFEHILIDSLDFFNIDEAEHGCYFLVDTKTSKYKASYATKSKRWLHNFLNYIFENYIM